MFYFDLYIAKCVADRVKRAIDRAQLVTCVMEINNN